VPVGRFVSFRIDTLTLNPGDPGYGVARERSGVEDGQPVEIRLEPNDPNYETYKAKFVESPYYQAQVGLVVETFEEQVAGLRGDLEKIQIGQRDDFMMQIGRAAQLHQTIVAAGLPESDTTRFQGTYNDIMNTTILRQLGLEGDRVPEQLMGLVDLIPTMCQLGVEFAKPGPVDPRLLGKLQLSIAAFEEIKRTLGQQDGLQGAVKDTIEFFERELSDMSKMGREGQNPVLRHISDVTAGHIQDPRVKDGGREWINDLEALPFLTEDQEAKAKAALILAQAGKIILRMDQPDLPIDVRLRMAGELDSLSSEFQTTIRGWSGRLEEDDVAGREALNRLQRLSLTPDLGDLKGIFRQINGTEIPDEPGNIDEAFRELGRNLEMMDRGLPLLDDEVSELKEQLEYLEGFGKDYIPAPGLRTQFQRLMGEVKRLRDFVGE
jgi:hypothetical protein